MPGYHSTSSLSADSPPPYRSRTVHQPRMFKLTNIVMVSLLIVIGFMLLFMILPKSFFSTECIWSTGGHRCLWPFGRRPSVLLIAFDGLRDDQLELVRTRVGETALPNFARLQSGGVRVNRTVNVFPTVSASNLNTIVTGLYPQHHGVTGNIIFDRNYSLNSFDSNSQADLDESPWLDHWPEPVWLSVQRRRGLVGTLLWPFTDRPVRGDQPFQHVPQFVAMNRHRDGYSPKKRVDTLLGWLNNPYYQLDMILAHFPEPGRTGESHGPESPDAMEAIIRIDEILGQLLDGLERHKLNERVELIITSGHALATTASRSKRIYLNALVDPHKYRFTSLTAFGAIYPNNGSENEVFQQLNNAHPNMRAYRLEDVPDHLYYNQRNTRMPPIVLIPDIEWSIVQAIADPVPHGSSGYPPTHSDMNTVFFASGPSFRVNETVAQAHLIDMYALLCGLLRMPPQPHNGSLDRISVTLKPPMAQAMLRRHSWPKWISWLTVEMKYLWLMVGLIALFTLLAALGVSLMWQRKHHMWIPDSQTRSSPPEYESVGKAQA